jgi:hypothetical protein
MTGRPRRLPADTRVFTVVLAAVLCGCGAAAAPPLAEELPQQVSADGLTVRSLYGRDVPEPFPLYPGATVHGSSLKPVTPGGAAVAAEVLLGSYDSWEQVADYYDREWVGKREDEDRTGPRSVVHFRSEKPGGNRVAVWVEHDSRGLSRDLPEWQAVTEGADPDSIRHGDPREVMIYVIVRWSGE